MFKHYLSLHQQQFEQAFRRMLSELEAQSPASYLIDAMRYSALAGGKRVRPVLVYAVAEALGSSTTTQPGLHNIAAALECIHTYSLIHDDLPAMDDDDLRRGHPTCHKQFDEATAILAGDALQAYAFELLAEATTLNSDVRIQLIHRLALASGACGMVAGQAIDLGAVNQTLALHDLEAMHNAKTGALIEASVVMGAIGSENASTQHLSALKTYAKAIGLAFQVQDDILDVISDTQILGKPQGADIRHNKPTYVSLLGLDKAKLKAQSLHQEALAALETFDRSADPLRQLSAYIVERQH